jgi:hypothetical protein
MVGLLRPVATALVALATVPAVLSPPFLDAAVATTPGVGFTADALPTSQVNGIGWSVTEANGVVYVGGTFSAVRPAGAAPGSRESTARNFVALNAVTGRPAGCRLSFSGTGASVRALGVSPDRRTLYAGGRFTAVGGVPRSNLAAVNLATCKPVGSFKPQVGNWVRSLAVAPNGRVYVTGDFLTVGSTVRRHFAAFSPTGSLLPWAPATDRAGFAIAVTPNGANVAIGGHFNFVNDVDSHALAVVNATTGQLVHPFRNHFIPARSAVKALVADASGIYTGNEGSGRRVFDGRIALDARSFRQRWRDTCLGATQDLLVDRGNLYAANHVHDCSSMGQFPEGPRHHLTVQSVTNPRLKVWWPDTNGGIGEALGPRALTISSRAGHRYLFAVGEFTTVNGRPQQGIMRLADAPDVGAPSAPSGLTTGTAVAGRVQVRWTAATDRDDRTLAYRVYRNRSTTPIAVVKADSDWWRRPQVSYTDSSAPRGSFNTYRVTSVDSSGNTSAPAVVGVRSR